LVQWNDLCLLDEFIDKVKDEADGDVDVGRHECLVIPTISELVL
jgi:hypothetical protein